MDKIKLRIFWVSGIYDPEKEKILEYVEIGSDYLLKPIEPPIKGYKVSTIDLCTECKDINGVRIWDGDYLDDPTEKLMYKVGLVEGVYYALPINLDTMEVETDSLKGLILREKQHELRGFMVDPVKRELS